jgi:hypothetical protein
VDAALSIPTTGLSHGACDTLQRAVNAVCAGGLSREWTDFFVTLARHIGPDGDLPERVLELAPVARAFIDRVRTEAFSGLVRDLCSESVTDRVGGEPVDVVRRFHRWIDLPEGRLVLGAYSEYAERCRRSRTSAVEVRRALVGLVAEGGDTVRPARALVLVETVQTAGEFGVPPYELSLELRGLAVVALGSAAPTHDRYALDGGLVRQFREQGFSVVHLIDLNREHCSAGPPESGALLRAWLPTLLVQGLTESKVIGFLIRGGYRPPGAPPGPGAPPLTPRSWDTLLQLVRAVEPFAFRNQALELVFGQFRDPADLEKRIRTVRERILACLARPGVRLDDLRDVLQQSNARQDGHAALLAVAGLPGRMSSAEGLAFFLRYMSDHPPHAEGSAEALRYREKTYDLIRRLHNISYGFTALKVVNQRMPDGGPSAFDEFGDDLFEHLYVVNVSSNDLFPGYGVLFVGPEVQRIFVHDLDHPSDPLHRFRAAWTDPRRLRSTHLDLDRYADAEFAFVRGFLGVSVPAGDFAPCYEVAGTRLTLMVWNNHFPGVEAELALLVPTSIYHERVRPCLIRCIELDKPHPDVRDACRAGLDPNAIRAECVARGLPYVDLGSPSVAGGGLVNGFRPKEPPYHAWEARLPAHETRDRAGHIHKSHILGGYRMRLGGDPELDHALQPLREGNDLVFDIVSSYLNLLDIFFMSFATWHRGDTLDAIDFESVFDEDEHQQIAETDEEEPFNPRNTRILRTAYAVHDQLVEFRAPVSDFRVYCSANPLHLYPRPEATITLDTRDMMLVVRGPEGTREISLARARVGSSERAELLWVRHVLTFLRRTGFDLRPYDRAAVASLLPNGGS